MLIDLSLFTKSHHFNKNTTFLEYANSLRERILNVSSSCVRYDIIADQYFKDSLNKTLDQVEVKARESILKMKQRSLKILEIIS